MSDVKAQRPAPTVSMEELRERASSIRQRRDLLEGYL
jgi:hypothetical protein